jgi:hypothetical protein
MASTYFCHTYVDLLPPPFLQVLPNLAYRIPKKQTVSFGVKSFGLVSALKGRMPSSTRDVVNDYHMHYNITELLPTSDTLRTW